MPYIRRVHLGTMSLCHRYPHINTTMTRLGVKEKKSYWEHYYFFHAAIGLWNATARCT